MGRLRDFFHAHPAVAAAALTALAAVAVGLVSAGVQIWKVRYEHDRAVQPSAEEPRSQVLFLTPEFDTTNEDLGLRANVGQLRGGTAITYVRISTLEGVRILDYRNAEVGDLVSQAVPDLGCFFRFEFVASRVASERGQILVLMSMEDLLDRVCELPAGP